MKIFCCVFLLLSAACIFGQSEYDFMVMQNPDSGITIAGYAGTAKEVVIPERIGSEVVTAIGKDAFSGKDLVMVTIPHTVSEIGESAFADNKLSDLTIPAGVYIIWNEAFRNNAIENLSLPDTLSFIGEEAFRGNKIIAVTWPADVEIMRIGTFGDNPVKTVSFGGARFVLDSAFTGSELETITIGRGVTIDSFSGIERPFINFYESRGRRPGIYSKSGRTWVVK